MSDTPPTTPRTTPDDLRAADVWVFDLDNTLYPASSRLFDQVDWNMTDYVANLLGLQRDEARKVQKQYFREYGTTMCGLMTVHGIDPAEFLAYVHDIDLAAIGPNPGLAEALERLPGRKVIFTNGSTAHAQNITRHIGIDHHFEGCFDIVDAEYVPKPAPDTYETVCRRFDIDPTSAIMVEDMAKNLKPAAAMGMTTVWLDAETEWSREGADQDHVHHRIDDLATWLKAIIDG